jgi:hypothetical protein
MRDETNGNEVGDAGRRLGRRGVLTGLVGLAGLGTLSGRARASHELGSITDQSVDAGDLSRGQTVTVQSVEFEGNDMYGEYDLRRVEVTLSGVAASDVETLAIEHDGMEVGSVSVDATTETVDITDVTVSAGTTEALDLLVTVASGADAGTLTLETRVESEYVGGITGPNWTNSATDGAPESIVVPDPEPTPTASPRFSLVADAPSWKEGVDGMERVTVTPEVPRVGEPVTVEVTVTNVGTWSGRYRGVLTNWFEILGREEVFLDVGEKTTLSYEFAFEKSGTHRLFLSDDHVADVVVEP